MHVKPTVGGAEVGSPLEYAPVIEAQQPYLTPPVEASELAVRETVDAAIATLFDAVIGTT